MKFIPLSIPNFEGNERKYVDEAIDQGWVSTGGAYIRKLEEKMAHFLHVENVAACQSGTSALHLALVETGVGPGDVVIVPPLTFIAAVNPVKYQFATPIFIDCDDSFCIDPIKLQEFCEKECHFDGETLFYKGKTVKALIVVHVFGNMADMVSILKIARKYNIKVIEDATEALGTKYTDGPLKGKYAGTIGDFGCYSFNGNNVLETEMREMDRDFHTNSNQENTTISKTNTEQLIHQGCSKSRCLWPWCGGSVKDSSRFF